MKRQETYCLLALMICLADYFFKTSYKKMLPGDNGDSW